MEQLYEMFPHLKEKLEAQLAKIPAERREWFVRNQAAIFAKLQQQHRLQSANTPTTVNIALVLAVINVIVSITITTLCSEKCSTPNL